jgi:hypothetical protein
MKHRIFLTLLFLLFLAPAQAEEPKTLPSLQSFGAAMQKLVAQEYKDLRADIAAGHIDMKSKTRKFMIHFPLMTGEWQEAVEVEGPDRHGIMMHIEVHALPYDGQAMAPQVFNNRYYQRLLLVPESKKCSCYLHATLSYPDDTKPEFIKAWTKLVNGFEGYVG